MNKIYLTFNNKFNVPEKFRNLIGKILKKEEIILLNLLVDKEKNISNITSKFPQLKHSSIESLYKKGYLTKKSRAGENYYKSNTFDQILKRFINHNPEYQELSGEEKTQFQECITEISLEEMRVSKKPVYRVIPIEETIQDKRQLVPHQQALIYLQESSALSVVNCLCRMTYQRCDKPLKVCLALGEKAKFFINRGIGEEIDTQKGLEILDISRENGLVHSIDNSDNPNYLCNCCECCCVFVQGLKKYGIFTSIGKSGFIAVLNQDLCNQCGICVEKCIFEAISFDGESIIFDKNKCFGCGLCAYNCPLSAIKLTFNKNIEKKIQ